MNSVVHSPFYYRTIIVKELRNSFIVVLCHLVIVILSSFTLKDLKKKKQKQKQILSCGSDDCDIGYCDAQGSEL